MAEKLRIFPILSTQLQFSVSPPIFEPLATQVLGNAADDSDGFSADLLSVVAQLESDTNLVAAGDADLASADFTPGQFAAANIDPVVQQTGVFTVSGDTVLKTLEDSSDLPTDTAPPVTACTPIQGTFDLPPCDFGNTALDGKVYAGLFQFGFCEITTDTRVVTKANVELVPEGAAFLSNDAAFTKVEILPGAGTLDNQPRILRFHITADKQGHFQAVVLVSYNNLTARFIMGVCVDIADSQTLVSKSAVSVLPVQG